MDVMMTEKRFHQVVMYTALVLAIATTAGAVIAFANAFS